MSIHGEESWAYVVQDGPRELTLKRRHWEVGQARGERKGIAIVFRDEAHARLIASAPDLLKEREELVEALLNLYVRHRDHIRELPGESGLSDLVAAESALRKAGRLP